MTLPRRRFSCLVVGVVALAMFSRQAEARVARLEVHALPSLTLTDQQILLGARDGTAVMLAGELRIPRPGNDNLPAVVLLQASGGFGANLNRWLRELNEMDVATFALDSFAVAHDANATEATVSAVKPILRSAFKLN